MNNFRGDLTDISAKTKPFGTEQEESGRPSGHAHKGELPPTIARGEERKC